MQLYNVYNFRYNLPILFIVINNNGITMGLDKDTFSMATEQDPCLT